MARAASRLSRLGDRRRDGTRPAGDGWTARRGGVTPRPGSSSRSPLPRLGAAGDRSRTPYNGPGRVERGRQTAPRGFLRNEEPGQGRRASSATWSIGNHRLRRHHGVSSATGFGFQGEPTTIKGPPGAFPAVAPTDHHTVLVLARRPGGVSRTTRPGRFDGHRTRSAAARMPCWKGTQKRHVWGLGRHPRRVPNFLLLLSRIRSRQTFSEYYSDMDCVAGGTRSGTPERPPRGPRGAVQAGGRRPPPSFLHPDDPGRSEWRDRTAAGRAGAIACPASSLNYGLASRLSARLVGGAASGGSGPVYRRRAPRRPDLRGTSLVLLTAYLRRQPIGHSGRRAIRTCPGLAAVRPALDGRA